MYLKKVQKLFNNWNWYDKLHLKAITWILIPMIKFCQV